MRASRVLIVAQSARRLAQSAHAAGFRPIVIDAYGDQDTRAVAEWTQCVVFTASGFAFADLREALSEVAQRYGTLPAVYGGGFEFAPRQLYLLDRFASICGNPPKVLERVTTPSEFFPLLARLEIVHPETVLAREVSNSDALWLIKHGRSCGGAGIAKYSGEPPQSGDAYLQKAAQGESLSAVFVADGSDVNLIGWTLHFGAAKAAPWQPAGAATTRDVHPEVARGAMRSIERLVPALGLKGLCGADFIVDANQRPLLVDLNVRPTASFELQDLNGALFRDHLQAVSNTLPAPAQRPRDGERAYLTIYARRDYRDLPTDWPGWVSDIPCAAVESGHPLCTVTAEARDTAAVIALAQTRAAELRRQLNQYLNYGEQL